MKRLRLLVTIGLFSAASALSAATIEIEVNGLVCAFCAQGIEKTLKRFPATEEVLVDLEHRLVAVALKEGHDIDDTSLTQAITEAGYSTIRVRRTGTSLDAIRVRLKNAEAVGE
jgi:mercuric ion binding protein